MIDIGPITAPCGKFNGRLLVFEPLPRVVAGMEGFCPSLQHLYLRFLLDIGDSGTHNVLIREDHPVSGRLIAGIDLEETRAVKEKAKRLEHLFKKPPTKSQILLYESNLSKISTLSARQLDQHTLDGLRAVGIDFERLRNNIALWERLH